MNGKIMEITRGKETAKSLEHIEELFLVECQQRDLPVERDFAHFFIHLLARDARDGLDEAAVPTDCKLQRFLQGAVQKFADPLDATGCSLKLTHFFKNANDLQLSCVREKYEAKFKQQLRLLINEILQYPETSNKQQLDQMCGKMQVFIVARYNLGSPNNYVLLKQTQQSLQSVIGRGDLQNYVLKKKYHRLEYLERLSATVAGILIYNNHGPTGEKENMREILADLDMAQHNTRECLEAALKRATQCKNYGYDVMERIVRIDVANQEVHCQWPLEKVREINKYVALFNLYDYQLRQVMDTCDKTLYLISVAKKKLECVVAKINDVLKGRSAIESELIFPHFVYLSELWSELVLYLNHLAELSRIKEQMDLFVCEALETKYVTICEQITQQSSQQQVPITPTFAELLERTNQRQGKGDFLKMHEHTDEYCAVTIALTNGLLVPAHLKKKLCENLKVKFGFSNIEVAKYAERNFEEFLRTYKNAICTSVDLILLLKLEDDLLQAEAEQQRLQQPKFNSFETQTEMITENDLPMSNNINVGWNSWDFHRETIRLANLRKRHTHAAQTTLCYGQRNAQNQTYYARRHF